MIRYIFRHYIIHVIIKFVQRKNFENAKIDDAYSIEDTEALPILYDLIQNEGLSLGTSCGINIAGAISNK